MKKTNEQQQANKTDTRIQILIALNSLGNWQKEKVHIINWKCKSLWALIMKFSYDKKCVCCDELVDQGINKMLQISMHPTLLYTPLSYGV